MFEQESPAPQILLDATFETVDELCEDVRMWDLDLRPISVPNTGKSAGSLHQIHGSEFGYGHCSLAASFDQYGGSPPGVVTFVFRSSETGNLWWRSQDTDIDDVLVYKPGSEVRCISGQNFEIQSISLQWSQIQKACEILELTCPTLAQLPETIRISKAERFEMNALLSGYRTNPEIVPETSIRSIWEKLVWNWIAQRNTRSKSMPNAKVRSRGLRNCLDYLEDADLAQVNISTLRTVANVSDRTLQYAFQDKFDVTMQEFLRSLRLSQARSLLADRSKCHLNIGDVARSLGLWHHGRFTQEYKRMFGETPQQTRMSRVS